MAEESETADISGLMKYRESDLMRRSWLDRNPWASEVLGWLYEFRVLIVCGILIAMLIIFHGCEIRVTIDSHPSKPLPCPTCT